MNHCTHFGSPSDISARPEKYFTQDFSRHANRVSLAKNLPPNLCTPSSVNHSGKYSIANSHNLSHQLLPFPFNPAGGEHWPVRRASGISHQIPSKNPCNSTYSTKNFSQIPSSLLHLCCPCFRNAPRANAFLVYRYYARRFNQPNEDF